MCSVALIAGNGFAMDKAHDHSNHAVKKTQAAEMDHSKMDHGAGQNSKQMVMVDGIHAQFEVMDLAMMNMTDPEGRTHHVMASFTKDGSKIEKAVGKVKFISPSGKEQITTLQDFGGGVFAANFTLDEKGKWGMICLFKDKDGKHIAKFWYQHDM